MSKKKKKKLPLLHDDHYFMGSLANHLCEKATPVLKTTASACGHTAAQCTMLSVCGLRRSLQPESGRAEMGNNKNFIGIKAALDLTPHGLNERESEPELKWAASEFQSC